MIKERFRKHKDKFIPPPPSKDFLQFIESAWQGKNENMPTHGMGERGIFDYYGKNDQGNERARFRIPWGYNQNIEKNYHIVKKPNGEFLVTLEGFFPHKK